MKKGYNHFDKAVGTNNAEMGAAFGGKQGKQPQNRDRKSKPAGKAGATKAGGGSASGVNKYQASGKGMGY